MRVVATIAVLVPLTLSAALADVYRSVDAQGHVQYSDTPSPGAQLVRFTGLHETMTVSSGTANSGNAGSPPLPTKSGNPTPRGGQTQALTAEQVAARSVQNDVAQTRAEQCKQAQDAYNQSVQARRIYRPGADGSREYLSDDEADKVRLNNRLEMEAACKDSTSPAAAAAPAP